MQPRIMESLTANVPWLMTHPLSQEDSILVTGALGSVGRTAVFAAKSLGVTVIAGVRKRRLEQAGELGADSVVAIDDETAVSSLRSLDAVADTVDGAAASILIARVKTGGIFASVVGPPQNSDKFPAVKVVPVFAQADAQLLVQMAEAVAGGRLDIPIGERIPLKDAFKAHALMERGADGKILLVA